MHTHADSMHASQPWAGAGRLQLVFQALCTSTPDRGSSGRSGSADRTGCGVLPVLLLQATSGKGERHFKHVGSGGSSSSSASCSGSGAEELFGTRTATPPKHAGAVPVQSLHPACIASASACFCVSCPWQHTSLPPSLTCFLSLPLALCRCLSYSGALPLLLQCCRCYCCLLSAGGGHSYGATTGMVAVCLPCTAPALPASSIPASVFSLHKLCCCLCSCL